MTETTPKTTVCLTPRHEVIKSREQADERLFRRSLLAEVRRTNELLERLVEAMEQENQ